MKPRQPNHVWCQCLIDESAEAGFPARGAPCRARRKCERKETKGGAVNPHQNLPMSDAESVT